MNDFGFVDELNLEECVDLKDKVSARIKILKDKVKSEKDHNKEERTKIAKETLKPGDVVAFYYKDMICNGEVTKLNPKTFSVAFEFDGEDKVLPRLYHLFVKKIEEETAEAV